MALLQVFNSKHSTEGDSIKYVNRMVHLVCLHVIDSMLSPYISQNEAVCKGPEILGTPPEKSVDRLTILKGGSI